jgi:threonylcarbamoyladenosine tRNA methylthiotransferase MtaB
MAITTDIIVGFPGEGEYEFEESLAFVRDQDFAGGHIFTFSARSGTAAAIFPDQIPHSIRRERNHRMRAVIDQSISMYQSYFLQSNVSVLWQRIHRLDGKGVHLRGLSGEGLKIFALGTPSDLNQIQNVLITDWYDDHSLMGVVDPVRLQA